MKFGFITALILFALSFSFYLYIQQAHPLIGEEFMLFVQAERVLNGEIPYRDFFQFITPGSIYLAAFLFKIFGLKLSVMKVFIAFTGSIIVLLSYLLTVKIVNNKYLSLLPPILVIFYSIPYVPLFYHHWYAEIFTLLTIIFALFYIQGNSKRGVFFSGLSAGFTFLFLQHKGILIFFALVLFLFMDRFTNRKSLKTILTTATTGFVVPLTLFILYLYLNSATEKFFFDCFYWVINYYAPFNSLPEYLYFEKMTFTHYMQTEGVIPALIKTRHELLVGYLPLILLIYGAMRLFKNPDRKILLTCLSSLFLFLSALQRPDFTNIIYVSQPFFVLLAYFFEDFFDKSKLKTGAAILISVLLILNALYGCLGSIKNASSYKYSLNTPRGVIYFRSIEERAPYSDVFSLLEGELKNKRIFVYNWSTFFYFLSGKKNYTSYDSFLPGYNTDEQMDKLIDELKNKKIEYIIYDELDRLIKFNREKSLYPEGSKRIGLENKLNEYIHSNFKPVFASGSFIIYKLN